MVPAAQELAEGDEICAVNALIWLLLLENRDQWDLVAERDGFEPSVTFEISLRN
jgi:hypothetical protein